VISLCFVYFFWICLADSSNPHHHLHPRGRFRRANPVKEEDQGPAGLDTYLKFVVSKDPPEHAVVLPHNDNDYYIIGIGKCNRFTVKAVKSSEVSSCVNAEECAFLVNKDNFEILEWKKWADIKQGQIPFHPVIICKSLYIAKDNNGISSMTRDKLKKTSEVLTVNYEIKGQDFQTDDCEDEKKVKPDKMEVIKWVTADNKNCKPAKHVVKFDQGSDRTRSFLKSRTHAAGGAVEVSASATIPGLFQLGGKVSGKYDYSRLNSETTSKVDKDLHSVSMEIEVPPNHSCTIEIKSKTSAFKSVCSGQLYRLYKNGEEHTTIITDIYYHREVVEFITSMIPCKPVTDGAKCPEN